MKRGQQGKIVFKILGVIVGLALAGFGLQERTQPTELQQRGLQATVAPVTQYTGFKRGGHATYTAAFHFTAEGGRKIVVKHSFPEDVLEDFRNARPVEILYRANHPTEFVFARQTPPRTLVIMGAAVGVAAPVLA